MSEPQVRIVARYYEVRQILEVVGWSSPPAERLEAFFPSGVLSAPALLHPALLAKEKSGFAQDIPLGFNVHFLPPMPPPPTLAIRVSLMDEAASVTEVVVRRMREFPLRVHIEGALNTVSGEPSHFVDVEARIVGRGNALSIGRTVRMSGLVIDVEGSGNTVRIGDEVEARGHLSIRADNCRLELSGPLRLPRATEVVLELDGQTRLIGPTRELAGA